VHEGLPVPVDVATALNKLGVPEAVPEGPDFHPENKGWKLVWSDEFAGSDLDPTKWGKEESCWGGGNQERQCYTARAENVQVINGLLRLIALREDFKGPLMPPEARTSEATAAQPYTSGKVRTRGLADWKYGRFEMRAKLPKGQGTWPAFWMMPAGDVYGAWPASGEIDIMEAGNLGATCDQCSGDNGENRTSSALHFGGPGQDRKYIDQKTQLKGHANPADGYHVWAAEWGEGKIAFYLDGQRHLTVKASDWFTTDEKGRGNRNAPFDEPFYMMLNLAIGGTLPESRNELGVSEDATPSQMLVDWVRVYQCAEDMETGLACMEG
jgi:beta-glucanase (GH16 family)